MLKAPWHDSICKDGGKVPNFLHLSTKRGEWSVSHSNCFTDGEGTLSTN